MKFFRNIVILSAEFLFFGSLFSSAKKEMHGPAALRREIQKIRKREGRRLERAVRRHKKKVNKHGERQGGKKERKKRKKLIPGVDYAIEHGNCAVMVYRFAAKGSKVPDVPTIKKMCTPSGLEYVEKN